MSGVCARTEGGDGGEKRTRRRRETGMRARAAEEAAWKVVQTAVAKAGAVVAVCEPGTRTSSPPRQMGRPGSRRRTLNRSTGLRLRPSSPAGTRSSSCCPPSCIPMACAAAMSSGEARAAIRGAVAAVAVAAATAMTAAAAAAAAEGAAEAVAAGAGTAVVAVMAAAEQTAAAKA